jgi:hypothetical protein
MFARHTTQTPPSTHHIVGAILVIARPRPPKYKRNREKPGLETLKRTSRFTLIRRLRRHLLDPKTHLTGGVASPAGRREMLGSTLVVDHRCSPLRFMHQIR